jgi:uncharacterized protein YllA (UPF0747 family)
MSDQQPTPEEFQKRAQAADAQIRALVKDVLDDDLYDLSAEQQLLAPPTAFAIQQLRDVQKLLNK